jgi:ABC-type nitrate/sulfonate/bicarbonate transport system permease component
LNAEQTFWMSMSSWMHPVMVLRYGTFFVTLLNTSRTVRATSRVVEAISRTLLA